MLQLRGGAEAGRHNRQDRHDGSMGRWVDGLMGRWIDGSEAGPTSEGRLGVLKLRGELKQRRSEAGSDF